MCERKREEERGEEGRGGEERGEETGEEGRGGGKKQGERRGRILVNF